MKAITQWDAADRPRERLHELGPQALKNEELLAILLGSGTRELSAVQLAAQILAHFNNDLALLGRASFEDLTQFKGIGLAKAITILASLEMGRRRLKTDTNKVVKITCSQDIYQFIRPTLQDLHVEEFHVVLLNRRNQIIHTFCLSKGGLSATVVDTKLIFKVALQRLASSIILAHNHPSGNLKPSQADIQITKKIKDAAHVLDIQVLDHLIVTATHYHSFADEGLL